MNYLDAIRDMNISEMEKDLELEASLTTKVRDNLITDIIAVNLCNLRKL